MRQEFITLLSLGTAALLGASGAIAQSAGPGEGRHGPGGFRGPARFLELTEDQQAAARRIFEGQRPERQALRDQMRETQAALHESLESEQPDALLVGELAIQRHALGKQSRGLRDESMKALKNILNDEQKLKLEIFESVRGSKGGPGRMGHGGTRGRRGGGWGPPGPGPEPE